jgi:hypothetical protein
VVVRLGINLCLEFRDADDMKKTLMIIGLLCSMLMVGRAQQMDSVSLVALDTLDRLDTLVVLDSLEILDEVTLITEQMSYAVVYQDSLVTQLMRDKRTGYMRGEHLVDGFRVQVYASNSQQVAKREAAELQQLIENQIDVPVYTLSEPPFWKVRIGNFQTREEANEYKTVFLQLFPEMIGSTYVVPDKIIVLNN